MSITLMASAISTSTSLCSPSPFPNTKSTTCYLSTFSVSCPKTTCSGLTSLVPPLGLCPFSSWNGLRHLGVSISQKSLKIERKGRCKGKVVYASLFGVGAPEALVIGVVALLVFGPKGLAEVARNLGKTLRAFQPTIRELQDVSREFKSTLEREIGLDDISLTSQNTYSSNTTKTTSSPSSNDKTEDSGAVVDFNGGASPNIADSSEEPLKVTEEQLKAPASQQQGQTPPPLSTSVDGGPSTNRAYSSEEYLKITEEQLKAAASQQQEQTPSPSENPLEAQTQPQGSVQEIPAAIPPSRKSESET